MLMMCPLVVDKSTASKILQRNETPSAKTAYAAINVQVLKVSSPLNPELDSDVFGLLDS